MLVKWAILLIAMAAMAECQRMFPSANPRARPSHSPRRQDEGSIVGVNPTHPISYPWLVYIILIKYNRGANFCGGVTISLNWVMSAAKCFTDTVHGQPGYVLTTEIAFLYAGVYDRNIVESDPGVQINEYVNQEEIKTYFFIHPDHAKPTKYNNDIVLIKLKVPWKSTPTVSPITLGNFGDFMEGKHLTVSGWGKINGNTDKDFSKYLHEETGLKPISENQCRNYFSNTEWRVTDRMICTQEEGKGLCHGDSGGPLTTGSLVPNGPTPLLIGIVSWGMPNCTPSAPIVYTNVAYFKPWIARTICEDGVMMSGQCLIFSKDKLSWNDAKERCSTQNGRLATLKDPQTFKTYVLRNYDGEHHWVGCSDIKQEGTWVCLNGQPLGDRFPWNNGEPNAAFENEDCMVLWGGWAFSDAPCPRQYRYVCEKDGV